MALFPHQWAYFPYFAAISLLKSKLVTTRLKSTDRRCRELYLSRMCVCLDLNRHESQVFIWQISTLKAKGQRPCGIGGSRRDASSHARVCCQCGRRAEIEKFVGRIDGPPSHELNLQFAGQFSCSKDGCFYPQRSQEVYE